MKFTITGKIRGKEYSITYSKRPLLKATLSGDQLAVDLVLLAANQVGPPVGPVGTDLLRDLNDPIAAVFIIREVFTEITEVVGDVPTISEPDEGNIV